MPITADILYIFFLIMRHILCLSVCVRLCMLKSVSFTLGAIWRDIAERHNDAPPEMAPCTHFNAPAQWYRPKWYNQLETALSCRYRQQNSLYQLLCCGDLATCVNILSIFDVATPFLCRQLSLLLRTQRKSSFMQSGPTRISIKYDTFYGAISLEHKYTRYVVQLMMCPLCGWFTGHR